MRRRFHMKDCKPMTMPLVTNWRKVDTTRGERVDATLYKQLIGSLMYLVNTRPNIYFAVNQLSQFMIELTRVRWVAAKHMLRYLRGTIDYGLLYKQVDGVSLQVFTNVNWAGGSTQEEHFSDNLEPTVINCDNQSCIKLSENPIFHDRSKHIEIRYHHIKDCVQRGKFRVQYILTKEQTANSLTKALVRSRCVYFKDKLGVV
eukprot:PITA_28501